MADNTTESRITELEIKLTFLDDTVNQLNQVVYMQQKTIDELQQRMTQLDRQLKDLQEASATGELPHEKPPHY